MAMGWISATKKSGVVKRHAVAAIARQIKPALVEVNGDLKNYNVVVAIQLYIHKGPRRASPLPIIYSMGNRLWLSCYHLIRFAI